MPHPIEARNFVDRVIEAFAPRVAANRYAARAQIEFARSVPMSSFRGAIAGRASNTWSSSTSYRGGTTWDRGDLGTMRDRARTVYRENVIGRSLLNSETDNVAAEGFSLQMRTKTPDFNSESEDRFYKFMERADITGKASASELFRMSWREPRKDGDGGFVLITRGGYPYLQYIPGDLILDPRTGFDFRTMFSGVECDPAGRPVRFFVRDIDQAGKDTVTPIDARDFVYLPHLDDPGSVRGSTVYASIFQQLDQIDTYIDSITKASIMACIFGLIEKRKNPAAALAGLGTIANSEGIQQKAVTLDKDGMIKVMGTDENMVQVVPQQPIANADSFIRAVMRIICLAFDMPLEIGQKDLSQVNFSGGRIGLIGYYRSCRVKQDWLKSRCWNRIVFWWLSKERQRQQLGFSDAFVTPFPGDYGTFMLHGREWDYNDPQTEAAADLLEISMGIKSPQMACDQRGRDWSEIQDQIEEARQSSADRKIPSVLSALTRDETVNSVTAADGSSTQAAQ